MDDITISWGKIACLFAISGIQIGILSWAWKCIKAAKEAAQLEIQADKLKFTKPKTWVAEIFLSYDKSKSSFYMFHCIQDSPPWLIGKPYLYSGGGFVKTDNPDTAILLQQLLNDGQLTVKPFNPDTNDLSK